MLIENMEEEEDKDFRAELEECIIKTLSNIQISNPQEVEKFLNSLEGLPSAENIKRKVLTNIKEQEIGGILTTRFAWFVRDAILENENQFLLRQLIWWVKQAAHSKSMASWIILLVKMLVNIVYLPDGVSVFKTPDLLSETENIQ
jgi:hypothetical protein